LVSIRLSVDNQAAGHSGHRDGGGGEDWV